MLNIRILLLVIAALACCSFQINASETSSVEELTHMAELGDVEAQAKLGYLYDKGDGVPQDKKEAAKWYRKEVESNDASFSGLLLLRLYLESKGTLKEHKVFLREYLKNQIASDPKDSANYHNLALLYTVDESTEEEKREGVEWLKKAADLGDVEALQLLGRIYSIGTGVPIDKQEALKWFIKAGELGSTDGQRAVGALYYLGDGIPQDKKTAFKWFKKAAEGGDAEVQYSLGEMYYYGDGIPQDPREAVKWYGKSAKQGDADAQYTLGWLYYNGEGVEQNKKEADVWFSKATEQEEGPPFTYALKWYHEKAEAGDARAQFYFLLMYLRDGTYSNEEFLSKCFKVISHKSILKWASAAADRGDAGAQALLSLMYHGGEGGVRKNMKKAFKWAYLAAMQDSFAGQFSLGILYKKGEGVLTDKVKAYAWFSLAAIGGEEDSTRERDLLTKKLSESERKQGLMIASKIQQEIVQKQSETVGSPENEASSEPTVSGTGSAFIITTNGYILTCYHVIDGASKVTISIQSKEYPAEVIRTDKLNDVALLKIDGTFPALAFAHRNSVKMGSEVFTIGYPNPILQGVGQKLTEGTVNAITGYRDDIRLYQISTPIQPGNSGGALLNEDGDVVGIVVALLKADIAFKVSGSLPQNVNYALKSNYAETLLYTVPDAADHLQQSNWGDSLGDVVERVKKSVVMVKAYK